MPAADDHSPPTPRRWRSWVLMGLAALACGLVFLSYLRPELAVDLGNRLAACF